MKQRRNYFFSFAIIVIVFFLQFNSCSLLIESTTASNNNMILGKINQDNNCQLTNNWWSSTLFTLNNNNLTLFFHLKEVNNQQEEIQVILIEDSTSFYNNNLKRPIPVGKLNGNYLLQREDDNSFNLQITSSLNCEMLSKNITNQDHCNDYLKIFNNLNIVINIINCNEMIFNNINNNNLKFIKYSNNLQQTNKCKLYTNNNKYFRTNNLYNFIYIMFNEDNTFEILYKKKCQDYPFLQLSFLQGNYLYLEDYQILITKFTLCKDKPGSHNTDTCSTICNGDEHYIPIDLSGLLQWDLLDDDLEEEVGVDAACQSFGIFKKDVGFILGDGPKQEKLNSIIIGVSVGVSLGITLLCTLLSIMVYFACRKDDTEYEEKMKMVEKSVNNNTGHRYHQM
ncbi:hypothetical protein ABK040_013792 [Willaertia magna]